MHFYTHRGDKIAIKIIRKRYIRKRMARISTEGVANFLTSILYSLRYTPKFADYLHYLMPELKNRRVDELLDARITVLERIHQLYKRMTKVEAKITREVLDPYAIHSALQSIKLEYDGLHREQDVHDVLMSLFDCVQETREYKLNRDNQCVYCCF